MRTILIKFIFFFFYLLPNERICGKNLKFQLIFLNLYMENVYGTKQNAAFWLKSYLDKFDSSQKIFVKCFSRFAQPSSIFLLVATMNTNCNVFLYEINYWFAAIITHHYSLKTICMIYVQVWMKRSCVFNHCEFIASLF